jgi:NAD(P)-dependent dehydrogenase (short-subunit alcohol dehydrogenase family)
MERETALIVGVGSGLSASLARLLAQEGMAMALAARNTEKLSALAAETGALALACDASDPAQVERLFSSVDAQVGTPSVVIYNAGRRVRGPVEALDPGEVQQAWMIGCFGGFLVAQQAARRMLKAGRGTILFTGATASVKGFAQSAGFAMGKFALRGLAQSIARELAPKGIHVAHIVIDGGIASSYAKSAEERASERYLDPDAVAREYLHLHRQHRSAWTWELELRPHTENF